MPAEFGPCPRRGFAKLWYEGQAGSDKITGTAPWKLEPIKDHGICPDGGTTCASKEKKPKEKTIVLFITDGDDTCSNRNNQNADSSWDNNALRASYYAQDLYTRFDPDDPASSVPTFVIGYGGEFVGNTPTRLNWIAWGGSGLGQPGLEVTTVAESIATVNPVTGTTTTTAAKRWNSNNEGLKNLRVKCSTCVDAYVAPDADTLAAKLRSIIRGVQEGEYSASQSITENVYEYVDKAGAAKYKASIPTTRYDAIAPTRFVTTFTAPGFNGQLKAYQNDGGPNGGQAVLKWSAADKLNALVRSRFNGTYCKAGNGGSLDGECTFAQLHGGLGQDPPATNGVIQRRIYTTSRNGVYTFTAETLMNGTATTNRVALWPPATSPASGVAPDSVSTQGALDRELGLPLDSSTNPAADFASLQTKYRACMGPDKPAECAATSKGNPDYLTRMKVARREAREIILAFMAGATPIIASTTVATHRVGLQAHGRDRCQQEPGPLHLSPVGAGRLAARHGGGGHPAPAVRARGGGIVPL